MQPGKGNFEKSKAYPNNFLWIGRTVLPALLMFILLVIAFWFYAIPAMRDNLIESKKEMISELTNTGYALMQH